MVMPVSEQDASLAVGEHDLLGHALGRAGDDVVIAVDVGVLGAARSDACDLGVSLASARLRAFGRMPAARCR